MWTLLLLFFVFFPTVPCLCPVSHETIPAQSWPFSAPTFTSPTSYTPCTIYPSLTHSHTPFHHHLGQVQEQYSIFPCSTLHKKKGKLIHSVNRAHTHSNTFVSITTHSRSLTFAYTVKIIYPNSLPPSILGAKQEHKHRARKKQQQQTSLTDAIRLLLAKRKKCQRQLNHQKNTTQSQQSVDGRLTD